MNPTSMPTTRTQTSLVAGRPNVVKRRFGAMSSDQREYQQVSAEHVH